MSDLFASLITATRSLEAQRYRLDVTGQNIANVNTPRYTRRVVDLGAVPPESALSAGRGVEILGIRAQRGSIRPRSPRCAPGTRPRSATRLPACPASSIAPLRCGAVGHVLGRSRRSFARRPRARFTRRRRAAIIIGDGIEIHVLRVGRDGVRIGVVAPQALPVHRQEIHAQICAANCAAADPGQRAALEARLKGRLP